VSVGRRAHPLNSITLDVSRPYMRDQRVWPERSRANLEAVGFKVVFKTAGWRTGYPRREAVGKYPMWNTRLDVRLAGTRQLPGHGVLPLPRPTSRTPSFAYAVRLILKARSTRDSRRPTMRSKAAWESAQRYLARDLPTVRSCISKPLRPPARTSKASSARAT